MELYKNGIIAAASSFNPNDIITREQFCILLDKTLKSAENEKDENEEKNENENSSTQLPFTDANVISLWALGHVTEIYEKGLINTSTGEFKPAQGMTRLDAAFFLSNIFDVNPNYKALNIKLMFSDLDQLNEEQAEAVKNTYISGLMGGKTTGYFVPEGSLTRADAAAIMVKLMNQLKTAEQN
jgi:hypothetical protein